MDDFIFPCRPSNVSPIAFHEVILISVVDHPSDRVPDRADHTKRHTHHTDVILIAPIQLTISKRNPL